MSENNFIKKYYGWLIIFLGKILVSVGIWYMAQINGNLEKLNVTVLELGKTVQHVNDKMLFMEDRINYHERQIEKLREK